MAPEELELVLHHTDPILSSIFYYDIIWLNDVIIKKMEARMGTVRCETKLESSRLIQITETDGLNFLDHFDFRL